jgi:ABC-2 type transport system ATP-binding protein
MIQLHNLSKSFGTKKILRDISLDLHKGKVYGIVGENGAGKTTLFRCIAGLEIHDGEVTSPFTLLKNHLGFLETTPYIFTRITGAEYLQLFAQARKLSNLDYREKNIFDLPLEGYASNYSTGMKKKLSLLAILIQNNDVYILDEPFSGVDIQSNIVITEIILKLKELGKTVIISSHIFSTLQDTCDEIHLLQEGQFTTKALPEEYSLLESEMKTITIGNQIERLGLV